jgi:hypothetical protein
MSNENSHPTDQELLLAADGELSAHRAKAVRTHLLECWQCRARMSDLEAAIVDFVRVHHETLGGKLPPISLSRAQLSARLSEVYAKSKANPTRAFFQFMDARYSMAFLCFGLLAASLFFALLIGPSLRSLWSVPAQVAVAAPVEDGVEPNPKLTPGAARQVSMHDVCAVPHEEVEVDVPDALRERILGEYGLVEKREGNYEIDFLIAPLLGGTEDPQNLWPEPYDSPVWNARVKDDLEERLHNLVCSGKVDLRTAQNDISTDWIGAYKKYFNTDRPINLSTSADVPNLDSHSSRQNRSPKMWLSGIEDPEKSGARL